jgi:hypothetical protein
MVLFHSYVSLPEGNWENHRTIWSPEGKSGHIRSSSLFRIIRACKWSMTTIRPRFLFMLSSCVGELTTILTHHNPFVMILDDVPLLVAYFGLNHWAPKHDIVCSTEKLCSRSKKRPWHTLTISPHLSQIRGVSKLLHPLTRNHSVKYCSLEGIHFA